MLKTKTIENYVFKLSNKEVAMNGNKIKQLALMPEINNKLDELVNQFDVSKEALGNMLLALAISDENLVNRAAEIIKMMNIGGVTKQTD